MLSVGFDPSFIDTLVRVEDKNGNLADKLPKPGYHHRTVTINQIAGGNGVNISAILVLLNIPHTLVVPCNDEFKILLQRRNIHTIHEIPAGINHSVGVTWQPGEMQFNYAKYGLDKTHWTETVHKLWMLSPLQLYTNWGLNPTSPEWVSIQWLASCGWTHEEIQAERNVLDQAVNHNITKIPFLIEPGSVRYHHEKKFLYKLLKVMADASQRVKYGIFSSNEEEYEEYKYLNFKSMILHTATEVTLTEKETTTIFVVPKLKKEPVTFVGAGDAFIAGLIKSCLEGKLNIDIGIQSAALFLQQENK